MLCYVLCITTSSNEQKNDLELSTANADPEAFVSWAPKPVVEANGPLSLQIKSRVKIIWNIYTSTRGLGMQKNAVAREHGSTAEWNRPPLIMCTHSPEYRALRYGRTGWRVGINPTLAHTNGLKETTQPRKDPGRPRRGMFDEAAVKPGTICATLYATRGLRFPGWSGLWIAKI